MSRQRTAKARESAFNKYMDNRGYDSIPDLETWFHEAMREAFDAGSKYGRNRPRTKRGGK